jgi:hypothetical protein
VPLSVGRTLEELGHEVIYHHEALTKSASDLLVCAASEANSAILVALDADIRKIAQGYGVSRSRYKRLSVLKLNCFEPHAAERVRTAASLIEHEWLSSPDPKGRRIFIEIGESYIRTNR